MTTTENIDSGNRTRILVMDDEAHIRNITQKMLEKFGYAVTLTTEGKEAVAEYGRAFREGRPYSLVIMDLTIPDGMGGQEASQEILALDSEACLVISSGYSDDPVMVEYKAHGIKGIIPKPYRMAELKETVQKLIS